MDLTTDDVTLLYRSPIKITFNSKTTIEISPNDFSNFEELRFILYRYCVKNNIIVDRIASRKTRRGLRLKRHTVNPHK